jgi:hypothetical protein
MPDDPANSTPAGVRPIAILFSLCALYLASIGVTRLVSPDAISLSAGAPLLFGLELAGPYMFLLTAVISAAIAGGLLKLNNIVRHAASLIAITGIVMLIPSVSAATVMVQLKPLAIGGLGIIVRVIVAWYLSQSDVADQFKSRRTT